VNITLGLEKVLDRISKFQPKTAWVIIS